MAFMYAKLPAGLLHVVLVDLLCLIKFSVHTGCHIVCDWSILPHLHTCMDCYQSSLLFAAAFFAAGGVISWLRNMEGGLKVI